MLAISRCPVVAEAVGGAGAGAAGVDAEVAATATSLKPTPQPLPLPPQQWQQQEAAMLLGRPATQAPWLLAAYLGLGR
jgi:hypothetical protein